MGIMQKHEWEFRLKDGNCRVQAVRDNIIRCSYTKRKNWEQKSPVGIKVCSESSFIVSEDGEKTVFRTERVVLEADSKNGGFVWRNADDEKDSYPVLPIFKLLAEKGNIEEKMMYNTYNMGLGMVLAVKPEDVDKTMEAIRKAGDTPYVVGRIEAGEKGVDLC